jgi:ATP-dependent helicase/nuclease subunit A
MVVLPDAVLIADFKTGRPAPADPAATPVRYLRQLAAYRAVLQGLFPGRPVRCWLVWTEDAVAQRLPDALLDDHSPGREMRNTPPPAVNIAHLRET